MFTDGRNKYKTLTARRANNVRKHKDDLCSQPAHRLGETLTGCTQTPADERWKLPAEHKYFHWYLVSYSSDITASGRRSSKSHMLAS